MFGKLNILFAIMLFYDCYITRYDNQSVNIQRGLISIFIFLLIQATSKPCEIFKQTKWFWRVVYFNSLIYASFLIYLAQQNENDNSRLGIPVVKEMHTYDDQCDFTLENLWDNFDHYYLCHLIDWIFVALIFRDFIILNAFQILDEFLELSFQHILPHFRECWWDHVFVDILFSNTISILGTLFLMKIFKVEFYDWLGTKGKKFRDWDIWHERKYLIGFFMIFLVKSSNFLTGFFMINSLWVQPKCWINIYRLLTWFGIGSIGLKEHFYWITGKDDQNRTSQFRILSYWMLFLEVFVSLKFLPNAGNILSEPTPWEVIIPWSCFGIFSVYLWITGKPWRQKKKIH